MGLHHQTREYRLDIDSHLRPDGVWQIDAKLRFLEGTEVTHAERLFGQGRLALLQLIVEQGAFGRAQGATSVRVHMDIDGEVRDLILDDRMRPIPLDH
jgi:hypothetical protein